LLRVGGGVHWLACTWHRSRQAGSALQRKHTACLAVAGCCNCCCCCVL
jgi:hypothetical protein